MNNNRSREQTNELDVRNFQELEEGFHLSNDFVQKNYLSELTKHKVVPVPDHIKELSVRNHIRLFKLTKIVYDKNEDVLDKLTTVYNALTNANGSVIMVLDSNEKETNIYLGVRTDTKQNNINSVKETLEKSFVGNFAGSEFTRLKNPEIETLIENIAKPVANGSGYAISAVSGIPSLKDQDKTKFVQGIEKVIDAMKSEVFTGIFIADPVQHHNIEEIKRGYEQLYSQLVPFVNCELSFNSSDSQTITDGLTTGFTKTVNESVTKTQSYTSGKSDTDGSSKTEGSSKNMGAGAGSVVGAAVGTIGGPLGIMIGAGLGGAVGSMAGTKSKSETTNSSRATNESATEGENETEGKSYANSSQSSKSEGLTEGRSQTMQLTFENKSVGNLLEQIDEQLQRLKSSADFGMWNTACYFISPSKQTSEVAASAFKATMRGENSAVENSFINTWTKDSGQDLLEVSNYLKKLSHPFIELNVNNGLNLPYVTPGSLLSGRELAISFSLPKKSVTGLPVMEAAEFGRNVITYQEPGAASIRLGNIFHMGQEENTPVDIDVKSLAMHTFITGSTGSGKSNTIYQLLNELNRKQIRFLVVEPAKGEYKQIFGGRKNVHVYGTNPKYTPVLKINPFRFPEEIHVLEHIDRLVEIFNACWPMYAAMPAVLKEAIEKVYENKGWDLDQSIQFSDEPQYPVLRDLVQVLPEVINQSAYSDELKGNYIGALETRIRSLTNGIVGRMFTDDEIDNEVLFDSNCIVDLSRIGSVETKALMMGILFMRLQEHRQSYSTEMNADLKHVTVLEEAHHLLRRTSASQDQEGANLQGKSVEMITSAIAEMRTYGEGFIIADQSPNLLDQSVIRNTNTKIILRLPDGMDRKEVGTTASLNEDQMKEIPKLKTGVGVIYQNNWLQPVLCAIPPFENSKPYKYEQNVVDLPKKKTELVKLLLQARLTQEERVELSNEAVDELIQWLKASATIDKSMNDIVLRNLNLYKQEKTMDLWQQANFAELSTVISSLVNGEKLIRYAKQEPNLEKWNEKVTSALSKYVQFNGNKQVETAIIQCLLHEKTYENENFADYYFSWVENARLEKGVILS